MENREKDLKIGKRFGYGKGMEKWEKVLRIMRRFE